MWYLHVQIMRSWDTEMDQGLRGIQHRWYLRIPELEACIPRNLSFFFFFFFSFNLNLGLLYLADRQTSAVVPVHT